MRSENPLRWWIEMRGVCLVLFSNLSFVAGKVLGGSTCPVRPINITSGTKIKGPRFESCTGCIKTHLIFLFLHF